MKTILIFIGLFGVFVAPTLGDSLESLKTIVNHSMTTINDFRNNFQVDLLHKFDAIEQEAMNDVYDASDVVFTSVQNKLMEADANGVDARSCEETLDADLSAIASKIHPRLRDCEAPAITFASRFVPFIGHLGNTGYVMLDFLGETAKNLAGTPPNEAERCYKNFESYASATSYNYEATSQVLKGALDYLQDFLKGTAQSCFQRPVVHGKRDMEVLGQKVVACIDEKMNQY